MMRALPPGESMSSQTAALWGDEPAFNVAADIHADVSFLQTGLHFQKLL